MKHWGLLLFIFVVAISCCEAAKLSPQQKQCFQTVRKNSRKIILIPQQKQNDTFLCSWRKSPLSYVSDKEAFKAASTLQKRQLYKIKLQRQSKIRELSFKINQENQRSSKDMREKLKTNKRSLGSTRNYFSSATTENLQHLVNSYKFHQYSTSGRGNYSHRSAEYDWNQRFGHIVSWKDINHYLEDPTKQWKKEMDQQLEASFRYPGGPNVSVTGLPETTALNKEIAITVYYTGKDASGNDLCTVDRAKALQFWSAPAVPEEKNIEMPSNTTSPPKENVK